MDGQELESFRKALDHLFERHPDMLAKEMFNNHFSKSMSLIFKFTEASKPEMLVA